ncbi:MAG: hypothetical protein ACOYKZ_07130 [Chlamydiia bacterium]
MFTSAVSTIAQNRASTTTERFRPGIPLVIALAQSACAAALYSNPGTLGLALTASTLLGVLGGWLAEADGEALETASTCVLGSAVVNGIGVVVVGLALAPCIAFLGTGLKLFKLSATAITAVGSLTSAMAGGVLLAVLIGPRSR